jgi:hypothetical protein
LVAVADTVVPAATPETEMLRAFEDVTVSDGTGSAIAVAEVAPPDADTVATVSVCVLADDGVIDSVVAASAITAAIDSFFKEVMYSSLYIGFLPKVILYNKSGLESTRNSSPRLRCFRV